MMCNNDAQGGGHAPRGNSYNRNPVHHNAVGERRQSNHRTRSAVHKQQETSGDKQVLAAHQITFNQHIVMENR